MNILLLFGVFFVLIMLSVPIGVALGLATSVTICLTSSIAPVMVAQKAFTGLDSFTLIAIPFFMLAGNLMALGGIARRIVNLADAAVGKFTGGLGMATIIGCMFFAAISGSGPATVTAMGSIMLPEMEKRGYDRAFSTGLTATAGTIGVIIPPSIPFVIYGVASGTSVGDMFKAGFIPGILIGIGLMIVCWVISKKRGYKGIEQTKSEESFLKTFLDTLPALMAPIIILGGIYGGIFTPTEAAVVATVYSLIVGKFIYHELNWKIVYESYRSTADSASCNNCIFLPSFCFCLFCYFSASQESYSATDYSTNYSGNSDVSTRIFIIHWAVRTICIQIPCRWIGSQLTAGRYMFFSVISVIYV